MIEARADDASSNPDKVKIDPNAVRLDDLVLRTGNNELVANGDKSTFVRAMLTDTDNKPVQGVRVAFASTVGALSADSAVTDRQGTAQVRLVSPTRASLGRVEASVGGLNRATDVDFVPGLVSPNKSSITVNPSTLPVNGSQSAIVVVTLSDADNNPVPDGTPVRVQSSAGTITSDNPASTELGRATFTLQASDNPSTGTIRVVSQSSLVTDIRFGTVSTGAPASVLVDADPKAISVSGVGQKERASINLSVVDSNGNPIDESEYKKDVKNNVRVELLTRPDGGEFLAGIDAEGKSVSSKNRDGQRKFIDIRTADGLATVNLQAGKRPGVVEARVQVLGFDASDDFTKAGNIATTASIPQISIAAGPPNTLAFTAPQSDSVTNEGAASIAASARCL